MTTQKSTAKGRAQVCPNETASAGSKRDEVNSAVRTFEPSDEYKDLETIKLEKSAETPVRKNAELSRNSKVLTGRKKRENSGNSEFTSGGGENTTSAIGATMAADEVSKADHETSPEQIVDDAEAGIGGVLIEAGDGGIVAKPIQDFERIEKNKRDQATVAAAMFMGGPDVPKHWTPINDERPPAKSTGEGIRRRYADGSGAFFPGDPSVGSTMRTIEKAAGSTMASRRGGGYEPVVSLAHGFNYPELLLRTRLNLAMAGFPTFPCSPAGPRAKAPLTKHGYKDATLDAGKIKSQQDEWRTALIGMPTGQMTGIVIIDCDLKNGKDGVRELRRLEGLHGSLPDTLVTRTPSGGHHYWFKLPPGVKIKNSESRIAPGVDVRGEGGHVIVPPSMMEDGRKYEVAQGRFDQIRLIPDWLVEQATQPKKQKEKERLAATPAPWWEKTLGLLYEELAGCEEGSRNATLFKIACAFGRFVGQKKLSRDNAETRLAEAGRKCGLPEDEITRTIKNGLDRGLSERPEAPLYPDWIIRSKVALPDPGSQANIAALLDWHGAQLRYDEFARKPRLAGFKKYDSLEDAARLELWRAAHQTGMRAHKSFVSDSLSAIAYDDPYHPLREYLDEQQSKWDKNDRVGNWLHAYLGADDSALNREIGRRWLLAAVRRARRPGVKFDQLLVLEGEQETGKSWALRSFAILEDWFSDGVSLKHDSKKFIEQTRGKWIVEIAELDGMSRAEVEHVKAILSRQIDSSRMSYGVDTAEVPRAFILAATTNSDKYLKDDTGNRRFWTVKTGTIDLEALKRDVHQIWAQVAVLEAEGESLELTAELRPLIREEQKKRMRPDPWVNTLETRLRKPDGTPLEGKILVENTWLLIGMPPDKRRDFDVKRLGLAMRELGWEHARLRTGDGQGGRAYYYVTGPEPYREISVRKERDEVTADYAPNLKEF